MRLRAIASSEWPAKLAAVCFVGGAIYLLGTAGRLFAFLFYAPLRTGMSGPWEPAKLGALALLYAIAGLLLGIAARQAMRQSSPQHRVVARWSPFALLVCTGVIAYLLLIFYPLPYHNHHADKVFFLLAVLVCWTCAVLLYPQTLEKALASRWFYWSRLVVVNLLVFALLGELAVRLADPLLARSGLFSSTSKTPAGLIPFGEAAGSIRHRNSQGFQDRERSIDRTSAAPRILAVGDSFVWGAGVSYDENFTTLLEKSLQVMHPGTEVINFGVSGYQPDEYLSLLRWHGLQYRPDLVLLGFYVGNDLLPAEGTDLLVAGQRYKVHVTGNWVHDHLSFDHWYLFHSLNYLYRVGGARLRHLMGMPAQGFWDLKPNTSQPRYGKPDFSGWNASYLRIIQSRGDQYLKDTTSLFESRWKHTRTTLEEINRLLRSRRISWILVLLPAEEQVDGKLQRSYLEKIAAQPEHYDFEKPQRLLRAWALDNDVPVIDLTPDFRSRVSPQRLYVANDYHWNDAGHALAAASILPVVTKFLRPHSPATAQSEEITIQER
jgi:GDSL-like lipase/acylhydrolase family protein